MDKSTSTLRFQVWTERVRECHTSGMTVKAWCEQNNINQKTYYYWQRISLHYQPGRYPDPGIFTRISSCVQPVSQ